MPKKLSAEEVITDFVQSENLEKVETVLNIARSLFKKRLATEKKTEAGAPTKTRNTKSKPAASAPAGEVQTEQNAA